jgi:anti-sigma-K factor RskA
MSADPHVLELLPAYALGSLDEEERWLVFDHLSGCSTCTAELSAYQALTAQLALAAPEARPSPDLKRRLLARLPAPPPTHANQTQLSWRRYRPYFTRRPGLVWGVVSFLLILLLVASNLSLWQRVTRLEALRSDGMRAIPLNNTGLAPGAAGFVIIGADGQNGAFVVDALPTLEPDRQYQLWLTQNEERTSGAVFSVDEYGYGGGRIRAPQNLFEYSGCDISIEPAGGSPTLTGERVLGGSLK